MTIPESVKSIGSYAFENCSGLTALAIPESVTTIEYSAFNGCNSLTTLTLPENVESIDDYAFYGCSSLRKIYYASKEPVTASRNIFSNSTYHMAELYMSQEGKDLSVVPWNNFYDVITYDFDHDFDFTYEGQTLTYTILEGDEKTVKVKSGGTITGDVVIPARIMSRGVEYTVVEIGEDAFSDCSGLTSVTIPETVITIGDSAFSYCTGLSWVDIPNSVITIEGYAFHQCEGLVVVNISESVESIGYYAFLGCTGLVNIYVDQTNRYYADVDGVLYNKELTTLIQCPNRKTRIGIPESVTTIGDGAFYSCSSLRTIALPENLTSIGDYAFTDCISLSSMEIPEKVTRIAYGAFMRCTNLTSVTIPNSIKSIGISAFRECSSLTSVDLPESIVSIEAQTFLDCSGLTSVTIPESVTAIRDYAFNGCRGLTTLTIPESVNSIGYGTFARCSSLATVTIPKSISSIQYEAFAACNEVESIYYGADEPIEAHSSVFSDVTYNNAILYMSAEGKARASEIDPWKNFLTIEEYDFSEGDSKVVELANGIEIGVENGILVVQSATVGDDILIYNISGHLVKELTISSEKMMIDLNHGMVYIVRVGDKTIKIKL